MFVQDYLRDLKATSGNWFPGLKFLIMFIGAVVGPLVLLVVGGRDSKTPVGNRPGLVFPCDLTAAPHDPGRGLLDV